MNEKDRIPESLEVPATAEQAQSVVDEIDRITINVPASSGLEGIENHTAPKKIRWHDDLFFIRFPEGEANPDDPNSINVACVAFDASDGSRTSFQVELTVENGMQLTKHVYPPSESAHAQILTSDISFAEMALIASKNLADATRERVARIQERATGLHIATSSEADELIAKLRPVSPAPEKRI